MQNYLIAIILVFSGPALAEFDFQSYQAASYTELKAQHTDLLQAGKKSDHVISASSRKYVIPVVFIKELRELSAANKTVIKAWQTSLRVPDGFIDLYQHEFKAEFKGETIWIPVQERLLLPMSSELHPGDRFKLFVVVIGAKYNKLVLLATEFKSDRAPL